MEKCECGNTLKKDNNEKVVGCYQLRSHKYVLWCNKCFMCYPIKQAEKEEV